MTTDKEKLILLAGGGHAKVLMEIIGTSDRYEIAGILDHKFEVGRQVMGISVLGGDDMLGELYGNGIKNACIGVGSTKSNNLRNELYEKVKQIGFTVPYLIHPKAIIADGVRIMEGAQIMAGAIVQRGSSIGKNTIINTGAIIEHDCNIGSHVHISPGVVISGGCFVNNGAFIGAGATVIQNIKIGKETIVGAGAVVINDVIDSAKVVGVPAKKI